MPPCENTPAVVKDDSDSLKPSTCPTPSEFKALGGFKSYPTYRDEFPKSPLKWLKGKALDDDIGPYWRIHDSLYDLTQFIDKHPGGKDWLLATKGTDITEAFVTSHISKLPEKLLEQFHVRNIETPRNSPFTFREDGFYKTFKRKVRPILEKIGKGPSTSMLIIQNFMLILLTVVALYAAYTESYTLAVVAGVVLALTGTTGHNFFHQRDNWRMYVFDLMLITSFEWRISHSLSHHVYTNTIYDFEISILEPIWEFLPKPSKTMMQRYGSYLYEIVAMPVAFFLGAFRRARMSITGEEPFRPEYLLPLFELLLMSLVAPSFGSALVTWTIMHGICSAWFTGVGIITSHHHPDIYHAGDALRDDPDWGLCQLDATRDRKEIAGNLFFVTVNFGDHTLHHLLPTVDHSRLRYLYPVLYETCQEFNVPFEMFSQWDMICGKYKQMANIQPNINPPIFAKKAN